MSIDINSHYDIESFEAFVSEPEGYGVFNEDEDVEEISPCCSAPIIHGDLCSKCLEHI